MSNTHSGERYDSSQATDTHNLCAASLVFMKDREWLRSMGISAGSISQKVNESGQIELRARQIDV
jgi:hypothetical protein